jgi:UDP-N-acetylmuramoyl-L-alanyl-D-glutamate--2,6-diaminopimelate ligase
LEIIALNLDLNTSAPLLPSVRMLKTTDSSNVISYTFSQFIQGLNTIRTQVVQDGLVQSLVTDSRRVFPGAVFFALEGLKTNGNFYIEEAVDRGAVAIVTEQDLGPRFPRDFIQVEDVRVALAILAKKIVAYQDQALKLCAITGTNGKTTVSSLAQHVFSAAGPVGLLGTIHYDLGRRRLPSHRTTPESVDIFNLLQQMQSQGCSEAFLEVSSHGIDQKRVYGLQFQEALFLNLSQDHLDYHGSMETYYQVKKSLFSGGLGSMPRAAVINADCAYGARLLAELPTAINTVSFGFSSHASVQARNVQLFADHSEFDLYWPQGQLRVNSPLLGRYNVSNMLAVCALAWLRGIDLHHVAERIQSFSGVPGRMQRVDCGQAFNVLVDYAHTADALSLASEMLAEMTPGRLIVVFGCGGDRDRTKRSGMLQAAASRAALVVATADNPRSEPLQQIFSDMGGASSESLYFIEDRKQAISRALDFAQPGDCVLVAGKGHECTQEFAGTVIPFDDCQIIQDLLRLKGYGN